MYRTYVEIAINQAFGRGKGKKILTFTPYPLTRRFTRMHSGACLQAHSAPFTSP